MKMPYFLNNASLRTVAELNASALLKNYEIIRSLVPGQSILPMVKADGYGHGAEWVTRQLLSMPGLYGFGVATLDEGVALRKALGTRGRRIKIIVFSGGTPWSEQKGQICERFGLTSVIAEDQDWFAFLKGGWPERISYELKFNTGMNRLGMSPGFANVIVRSLRQKPLLWHPSGVLSHLALGESPEVALSRSQRECFEGIKRNLAGIFPSAQFHLGNSATIWKNKQWRLDGLTDVVRPGISLYGVTPWAGAPTRGIYPIMTAKSQVVTLRKLKAGESVGYGATFQVKGKREEKNSVQIAILGAGYADGLHRTLSNQGRVWLGGHLEPILGIISMDLCAVGCSAAVKVGDWAEILGPHLDLWSQAKAAGTIPYELLTSISGRVQRIYG